MQRLPADCRAVLVDRRAARPHQSPAAWHGPAVGSAAADRGDDVADEDRRYAFGGKALDTVIRNAGTVRTVKRDVPASSNAFDCASALMSRVGARVSPSVHGSNVMRNLTMCPVTYYIAGHDRFIFQQGSEAILGAR